MKAISPRSVTVEYNASFGLDLAVTVPYKPDFERYRHGDILPYANNIRLYEATGMGALLMPDWKENLHEMFEPGKEVVVYRSSDECVELIHYYLDHKNEREAIVRAGQEHTMREHIYYQRSEELVDIVGRYL